MKNKLRILFILITLNITHAQNQKLQSEWSVINILGAKVYEKASLQSKIITVLKVGKTIKSERVIATQEVQKIKNNFTLKGSWVEANVNGINGFVFSSDLSNQKVEVKKDKEGQNHINLLGNLKTEKSERKDFKTEKGVFTKYFEYKYYKNGMYTQTAWDGCFNHKTEYQNLKLNEVYHQMVSDYGVLINKIKFSIPSFLEKDANILKFEVKEGPTEDLKIEIKKNGIFVVSSYDCD